jgi:phage-related protein
MPLTELLVFRQANGRVPMEEWLDALPSKARAKCLYYMRLLAAFGHELRRPVAHSLREGIYELRPSHQGVPYRILYFFNGREVVVLSHGITKGGKVPDEEIRRALQRRQLVLEDPARHISRLASKEV